MVQIPTARDVNRVGTRSGRIAVSGPSQSVGQGMQEMGQGLVRAAFNMNDLSAQESVDKQKHNNFQLEEKLAKFTAEEEQRFNAARDTSDPSGVGFTRQYLEGYQQRADDFIKNNFHGISEGQDANARQNLLSRGNSLYSKANNYEGAAKKLYYDTATGGTLDTVREQIRGNAAPFEDLKKQGYAAIDAAPMDSVWKQQRKLAWDADAREAKLNWEFKIDPAGTLRKMQPGGPGTTTLEAIRQVESSGDPNAESSVGASGLMQVMPTTGVEIAGELGDSAFPVNGTEAEQKAYLKNPAVSLKYGEHYFNKMLIRYDGDERAALIAYNGGPARADEWVASGKDDSVLPAETRNYYKKVEGAKQGGTYSTADVQSARHFLQSRSDKDASHFDGMNDGFAVKLTRLIQAAPPGMKESLGVYSGTRSNERQRELFDEAVIKYGSMEAARKWVAPPGKSNHNPGEHGGVAADLSWNGQSLSKAPKEVQDWVHQNAEQYGLKFPLGHEPWHVEDSGTRGGKGGGSSFSAPSDPSLSDIPLDRRDQLLKSYEQQFKQMQQEQAIQSQFVIQTAAQNAPAAIQNTGQYTGQMPTQEDFTKSYGIEAPAKYQEFMSAVETGKMAFDMRTMSDTDIKTMLDTNKPTSTGDQAGIQNDRYTTLSNAAAAVMKARADDPAAYVQQTYPKTVGAAWSNANDGPTLKTAIGASITAQQQLGITDIKPLPKQMATQAVDVYKDADKTGEQRIAAVTQVLMTTPDKSQRRAIFEQLVDAGLPASTEGAFEALARGDKGASDRLFQAAIVDISKLPGQDPEKKAVIAQGIQDGIMAEGEVGDIYYGLSDGTLDNYERAQRDDTLITNSVNLRMRNGETLEAAIAGVKKDLYGDVVPVSGDSRVNTQILLPSTANADDVLDGLVGIKPQVEESLRAAMKPATAVEGAENAVVGAVTEGYVNNVMTNGFFRNTDGGYIFMDPYTGLAVAGDDGQPIVFKPNQMDTTAVRTERAAARATRNEAARSPALAAPVDSPVFRATDSPLRGTAPEPVAAIPGKTVDERMNDKRAVRQQLREEGIPGQGNWFGNGQ